MKSLNRLFVVMCFLVNAITGMAQFKVSGQCVDEKDQPLAGVNVVVFAITDTTHILKGAVSNTEGLFTCDGLSAGDYILRFSMVGFRTLSVNQSVNADRNNLQFVLKESSEMMKDIVVTAAMLKTFGNKDEIFLRKENLKIGNNALDAISSLPQFKKDILNNELTTIDQKNILILIDGIRASSRELQTLQSDDIKKLTYYSDPPTRYASENVGAVLDVITKRKKSRSLFAGIDTKNSFTTGYGTNIANVVYTDSLNKFSAYYFIDYRALNDNRMNNSYQYGENMINNYVGLPGSYKGTYHIGRLTYQRYQGSNLFNVKLEYRKSPGHEKYSQKAISENHSEWESGINSRNLESDYDSWSLDLYYSKNFTEHRSLVFNVINTYYLSNSNNTLSRVMENKPEWDYSYTNLFENKSYSLMAETLYSDKLWDGTWNVGASFRYKNLDQTFNHTVKSDLNYKKSYLYTDYSNQWKKLSYNIGVGLDNTLYHTADNTNYNFWVFRPSVSLNYGFNKQLSLRWTGSVKSAIPDIGYLTNNIVSIDEHFYSRGSTQIKPFYYYTTMLQMQYVTPDNKLFIRPAMYYDYDVHPNANILQCEDADWIMQYARLKNRHTYSAAFVASWNPVKWLTITPYYEYTYKDYCTPFQHIRHGMHHVGFNSTFIFHEVQVGCFFNAPFTSVSGDIYTRTGTNAAITLLWKHNDFSIGGEWIYAYSPARNYAAVANFRYEEDVVWHNFKNLCDITFTYYFSTGKARKHAEKKISNSDFDSGLIKANTAQ